MEAVSDFISGIFESIDWKIVWFLILMPLVLPIGLFLLFTYDWWMAQYKEHKIKFYLFGIVYAPLGLIYFWSFGSWTELVK